MKIFYRLITTIVAPLALSSLSFATGIIAQMNDQSQILDLIDDYPVITAYEQAGNSPFVRFEVDDSIGLSFTTILAADSRVFWAEVESLTGNHGSFSSHGSSVAAIFDRGLSYASNTNIWNQIHFVPLSRILPPIKVGIVDTGVSIHQPTILSNVIAAASFVPESPSTDDTPSGLDTNLNGILDEGAGHGTMVAGVILQLAPTTPLIISKSADSDGVGSSWTVLEGVVFCVEQGAKVVNLSLGSQKLLPGFSGFTEWVESSGTVVVSPIGNNGANYSLFPAGYSKVVCVTGLLPDNSKAPFSNWSSIARVAAPGTGMTSAWYDGGTAELSGTSLAAPLVTGCLAASLPVNPNATPNQIRSALSNSGRDIDDVNPAYAGQLGKLIDFVSLLAALKK